MSTETKAAPDVGGPELPPGWSVEYDPAFGWVVGAHGSDFLTHTGHDRCAGTREEACGWAWDFFGVTREEWARLQGVDANARESIRVLRKERDDAGYRAARLEKANAELRTRLTEAEGALETSRRNSWPSALG